MDGSRTNIVIDDKPMAEALKYSGKKTKRAVVEEALHLLVRLRKQETFRSLRGKVEWEGDLGAMRGPRLHQCDLDTMSHPFYLNSVSITPRAPALNNTSVACSAWRGRTRAITLPPLPAPLIFAP